MPCFPSSPRVRAAAHAVLGEEDVAAAEGLHRGHAAARHGDGGRTVDSEELREAMKDNGIGRPSTRAAIIETLHKRGYIRREGKKLVATQAGIDLIATINEELLKSAKLTGLWENKLRRIESGDYSPAAFVSEISQMVRQIVVNVLSDNSTTRIAAQPASPAPKGKGKAAVADGAPAKPKAPRITRLEQVSCPVCGQGHLVKGRTAFGCSRYAEGCGFRLPFEQCAADTKPTAINKLINKRK